MKEDLKYDYELLLPGQNITGQFSSNCSDSTPGR